MGFTVFHRATRVAGPSTPAAYARPAVAVCYGRGGLHQVDALVLNVHATALLDQLAGDRADECELLYDPTAEKVGIRPWHIGRPANTMHPVVDTRWRTHNGPGGEDGERNAQLRALWPRKIEAPTFMGLWNLPEGGLVRPSGGWLHDGMVVFNPREVVTA